MEVAKHALTNTELGRYTLLERIDAGGMAEVFRARLTGVSGFEREVAIKRILPNVAEDSEFIRMFIDEAKIAVQLNHPNIAQIYDLGCDAGTYYIAMELVHGRDMRTIFRLFYDRGQAMPIPMVVHIFLRVCDALHYAHFAEAPGGRSLALVHRDVTPQNILISYEGEVKVIDFGLARAAGRVSQTQAGVVKGKLAYLSPEQSRGKKVDHRTDIFATGICLWEMLTGARLFLGPNDVETVRRVQRCEVPPPRTVNPRIPPDLEEIVLRALARDIQQRYQTAMELHDDLQAFSYGLGSRFGTDSLADWMSRTFPVPIFATSETNLPELEGEDLLQEAEASRPELTDTTDTIRPPVVDTIEHRDDAEPTGHYVVDEREEPSIVGTTSPRSRPDGDTEHVQLPTEDEDHTIYDRDDDF